MTIITVWVLIILSYASGDTPPINVQTPIYFPTEKSCEQQRKTVDEMIPMGNRRKIKMSCVERDIVVFK